MKQLTTNFWHRVMTKKEELSGAADKQAAEKKKKEAEKKEKDKK